MKFMTVVVFIAIAILSTVNAGDSNCNACLTIVDLAVQVLNTGITDEQVIAMGDLGCSMVPAVARGMCPGVVQDIYDSVYDLLVVQKTTSQSICNEDQIGALGVLGCRLVPEVAKPMCPGVVQQMYDSLYDMLLVQKIPGQSICKEATLC